MFPFSFAFSFSLFPRAPQRPGGSVTYILTIPLLLFYLIFHVVTYIFLMHVKR